MAEQKLRDGGGFEIKYWIGKDEYGLAIRFFPGDSIEELRSRVEYAVSTAFTKIAKDNGIPSHSACDELWVPPGDC